MTNLPVNKVEIVSEENQGRAENNNLSGDDGSSSNNPDTNFANEEMQNWVREYNAQSFEEFCSEKNAKLQLLEEKEQLQSQLIAAQQKIKVQKKDFRIKLLAERLESEKVRRDHVPWKEQTILLNEELTSVKTQLNDKAEAIHNLESEVGNLKADIETKTALINQQQERAERLKRIQIKAIDRANLQVAEMQVDCNLKLMEANNESLELKQLGNNLREQRNLLEDAKEKFLEENISLEDEISHLKDQVKSLEKSLEEKDREILLISQQRDDLLAATGGDNKAVKIGRINDVAMDFQNGGAGPKERKLSVKTRTTGKSPKSSQGSHGLVSTVGLQEGKHATIVTRSRLHSNGIIGQEKVGQASRSRRTGCRQ